MSIKYPENLKIIAKILAENGYRSYAVGGCIRDAVMGRIPNDWDMTTSCSPEKMMEIFKRADLHTFPYGIKHGTVSILLGRECYECTTFRIDGNYTDSRHPDKVIFTDELSEDLRRRDFTVNAMAGDPLSEDGEIVDIFGGRADIEDKIIRAVGDPEKRFTEDALRILRAVRFATVLDFEIESETRRAAQALAYRLSYVSAERKSVELKKILLSSHADRGVSLLIETDTAKYIHPDIKLPKVCLSSLPLRFSTRLAALFDGIPELSIMKLPSEVVKQTRLLCDDNFYTETVSKFTEEGARARYMLSKYRDIAEDAALLRGDASLAGKISEERAKTPCIAISDLAVNGNDLLSVGIEGRKLGAIISSLLLSVIENPKLNEKEKLIEMALEAVRGN